MLDKNKRKKWLIGIGAFLIISIIVIVIDYFYLKNHKSPETTQQEDQNVITNIEQQTPDTDTPETTLTDVEYYNKGKQFLLDKNYNSAIENFDKAITINANQSQYYVDKSAAQYNLGDNNGAIQTINNGLIKNPGNEELLSQLDALNRSSSWTTDN